MLCNKLFHCLFFGRLVLRRVSFFGNLRFYVVLSSDFVLSPTNAFIFYIPNILFTMETVHILAKTEHYPKYLEYFFTNFLQTFTAGLIFCETINKRDNNPMFQRKLKLGVTFLWFYLKINIFSFCTFLNLCHARWQLGNF